MKPVSFVFCILIFAILCAPVYPTRGQALGDSGQTAAGSGKTPDQTKELEARVKTLEDRYEQSAGFHDTDYILRIQKQYEAYYEKAFNTQVTVVWAVGILFTAMLAVAGRFSFTMFEKRIEFSTSEASAGLKKVFDERLSRELAQLEKGNREHTAKAIENFKNETERLIRQVWQQVNFNDQFSQGLTMSQTGLENAAKEAYTSALEYYLEDKEGHITKDECMAVLRNLFAVLHGQDKSKFQENAKEELKKPLYRQLHEELQLAAKEFSPLAKLLAEGEAGPTKK